MKINTDSLVSITEANQNFSKITRLVDENGAAVILKNNKPRYVVIEFSQMQQEDADTEDVVSIGRGILQQHRAAFEELAK